MNPYRLLYLLAILVFPLIIFISVENGGHRLPRYYSPDGEIYLLGAKTAKSQARTIYEINGRAPFATGAVFSEPDPIIVKTNMGVGIIKTIPNNMLKVIWDFKFYICLALIFFLCGLWFIEFGNDFHLAALCFLMAVFLYSTFISLTYHNLQFLSFTSGIILIPAFLNMGLRTSGKEIPGILLLGELVTLIAIILIAFLGRENEGTIYLIKAGSRYAIFLVVLGVVALQLENALRRTSDPIETSKRWALFLGCFLGLLFPVLVFSFQDFLTHIHSLHNYIALLFFLFLVGLLYGTYRIQLVPFQFVITSSILSGLVNTFFIILYGGALLAHNLFLPDQNTKIQWLVHLVFIVSLVFFLDPARRKMAVWLQRRIMNIDNELTQSLERIANLISSPIYIQSVVNSIIKDIKETLGVEKLNFLFSISSFPDLVLKSDVLLRLSDDSQLWEYIRPERIIVTSYLTYGAGSRGELYRYLLHNNFYLAIGVSGPLQQRKLPPLPGETEDRNRELEEAVMRNVKAALLVGNMPDHRKLKLSEIRYLQEAARLIGMLIYNYTLLIQEVQKRRRMRELYLAGLMQRNIANRSEFNARGVRLSYFLKPVISVTGDYLDLFTISENEIAVFLGDVSGHGLGTGYLVSAIRSIVRSHLKSGATLVETVETLNLFLLERYRGAEFITLFGFILNTETGRMEYLNAAHPGPYLRDLKTRDIIRLENSQRLLGILPTPFVSSVIKLREGDRLFLYSDGVTETFNQKEVAFGESGLNDFISSYCETPLEDITELLEQRLRQFRGNDELSDDTTFIALEYSPGFSFRNILSFLNLEQKG